MFSKEFGWTIPEIADNDIYQLECYFEEMSEAVKNSEKGMKNMSGTHNYLNQKKMGINSHNDLIKFKDKLGNVDIVDKRKGKS